MNPETFQQHRRQNRRHSLIMMLGMAAVLAACGWLFAGRLGVVVALAASAAAAVWAPQASARLLLKMYRAQPLTAAAAPEIAGVFDVLVERSELAERPKLYYVPSQLPNAFAVGAGRQAAVAVTDGLLRMLTIRELAGVLAHELSHIRHRDTRVMALADMFSRLTTSLSQIGQLLLLLSLPALLLGAEGIAVGGLLALVFAPSVSAVLQLALSRSREFDADLGAVELTGDPEGLAAALWKLEKWQEGPWWKRILLPKPTTREPAVLRTHPHTEERIARLKSLRTVAPTVGEPLALAPDLAVRSTLGPVGRRPRWHVNGLWY